MLWRKQKRRIMSVDILVQEMMKKKWQRERERMKRLEKSKRKRWWEDRDEMKVMFCMKKFKKVLFCMKLEQTRNLQNDKWKVLKCTVIIKLKIGSGNN